jgi:hypothetical protein
LQSIPSYIMSIFQLPTTLINTIERMMNSFWWGRGTATRRGINWLNWEKLSMHKNHGGMGFKDLSVFNLAMLGKQGWKFQTDPTSLVSRIFKARYFPKTSYFHARLGHNPSYVWRSIFNARFIVRGGARWRIGTGESIPLINEPWMLNGGRIDGSIAGAQLFQNSAVKSLLEENEKKWNESLIRHTFNHDIATAILKTPLIVQVQQDKLIWKAERNGKYSVRSAYRLCVEELIDTSHIRRPGYWAGIWKLKVPPKIRNLIWRVCRGVLPTRMRLLDKGVQCPTNCVSCNSTHEDLWHLCFDCPFAIQVWGMTDLWHAIQSAISQVNTAAEVVFHLLRTLVQFNVNFLQLPFGVYGSTGI